MIKIKLGDDKMKELVKIFENEDLGKIRVVILDGEPWFVGKDVSEILGYVNPSSMYKLIDESDKRNIDPQSTEFIGSFQNGVILEPNTNIRKLTVINESGLYDSIFGSTLESAKTFKKWVTSVLLPTIRKTGGYVVENRAIDFVSNWLPNLDDMSKTVIAGMLEDNQKLRLENTKQKEVIEVQVKEIEYKEDVIIGLVDKITLEEKRQTLNKVVKHKGANYSERWSLLYKHFQDKYHLDLKIRRENWDKVNKPKSKSMVDFVDRGLNKVPELYEIACKLFHSDIEEIVQHYKNLR